MTGSDIEHQTEIRRAGPPLLLVLGAVGAVALLAVVVMGSAGGDEPGPEAVTTVPATPTSETLTTTEPPPLPPVLGVTRTRAGPRPSSTADPPAAGTAADPLGAAVEPIAAVATEGVVVCLTASGDVLFGRPGAEPRLLVSSAHGIHPSTEPGHVWVLDGEEAALWVLEGGGIVTELAIGARRVIGPARFGLVTVDADEVVRWHRPLFEPTVVTLPEARTAVDAGGGLLLVETPSAAPGERRLEVWGIADGRFRQSFEVPAGVRRRAVLATDGSHIAVPTVDGWSVRNASTGFDVGALPPGEPPVWIGFRRFATTTDGRIAVSDGSLQAPGWPVHALAEHSPVPFP